MDQVPGFRSELGEFLAKAIDGDQEIEVRGELIENKIVYNIGLRKTLRDELINPALRKPKIVDVIAGKEIGELTADDISRAKMRRQKQGDQFIDPKEIGQVKTLAGVNDDGIKKAEFRGDEDKEKEVATAEVMKE